MKKKQTRVERAAAGHVLKRFGKGFHTCCNDAFLAGAAWQRRECAKDLKKEHDEMMPARDGFEGMMARGIRIAIAAIKRSGKGK